MCFYAKKGSSSDEPRIAKRDIFCYKALKWKSRSKRGMSYIFCHEYYPGETQPIVRLRKGFGIFFNYIHDGYHSWIEPPEYANALCVIPKGTRYYRNSTNEMVSETIIVITKIK